MVTLEQVKLLESKVGKALDYVESLSAENATLYEKLDGYRRRIDELETIVLSFKEDQGRIEAGIVSALERLNQFEDAVERGIRGERDAVDAVAETEAERPSLSSGADAEAIPESAESDAEQAAPDDGGLDAPVPVEEKNGELDIF